MRCLCINSPMRSCPAIIDNRNVSRPKVAKAPADRTNEAAADTTSKHVETCTGVAQLMPVRVLIVDDSSVMRKVVERSLRQAGLDLSEVFEAGNGAEALAVLQANQTDLILCDINMPVMDGLEFIKQLPVENAKAVPVIMITTEGSEAHVVRLSLAAPGAISASRSLPTRSRPRSSQPWQVKHELS